MFDETLDGRLGTFETLRPKVIVEKVEVFLNSADERLVRMAVETQKANTSFTALTAPRKSLIHNHAGEAC